MKGPKALTLSLETLSPLHAGRSVPYQWLLKGQKFISGGLLRAAVAEVLSEDRSKLEAVIYNPRTRAIFRHFLPLDQNGGRAKPLPLSYFACPFAEMEEGHLEGDFLPQLLVWSELKRLGGTFLFPPLLFCPRCRRRPLPKEEPDEGRKVQLSRHTKVALSRARESAEHGMLYAVETIPEGRRFLGQVVVPDPQLEGMVSEAVGRVRWMGGGGPV